jgi:hypothetical protein
MKENVKSEDQWSYIYTRFLPSINHNRHHRKKIVPFYARIAGNRREAHHLPFRRVASVGCILKVKVSAVWVDYIPVALALLSFLFFLCFFLSCSVNVCFFTIRWFLLLVIMNTAIKNLVYENVNCIR